MSNILVLGAGRSSSFLIDYLARWCINTGAEITVADLAQPAHTNFPDRESFKFVQADLNNQDVRRALIKGRTVVVSMLPAFMHPLIAGDCLAEGVNMATASYESPAMKKLGDEVKSKGLWFLNECGLDPGIDHMSAMKIIHQLQDEGSTITGFYSYCGGLTTAESIEDSWGYKFSWNPRNVIVAGQGTASYLENGKVKFLPYQRLFRNPVRIEFSDTEVFEGYANRDSLSYQNVYGLDSVQNLMRGTLRRPGYIKGWNVFVQLGITDDTYQFPLTADTTYADFISSYLPGKGSWEERLIEAIGKENCDSHTLNMIHETGIFSNEKIGLDSGSPALILQKLLESKWKLRSSDNDLIVMQHIFDYTEAGGAKKRIKSSLSVTGDNDEMTGMAKTVGLPLGITVRNFLEGKIKRSGLVMPVTPDIYTLVLKELETVGIAFNELAQNR